LSEIEMAPRQSEAVTAADAALVKGLRARTPEACAELYDRYAAGIHRSAVTRLGGDVAAAEDVVAETMVWVTRDIRRFAPQRSSLAAWVYGIARRRVLLELRGRQRQKSVPAETQVSTDAIREISDGVDTAAQVASRLEARRRVAALRKLLTETEFEVLVLSCVEELSAREVGQVIRRSERAVHSILHRARKKARERPVGDE
jgi:RNA polymerase sigma-70 factor (ECF subfamily)